MSAVLSNDDGVHAQGLATLHEVVLTRRKCLVIAPSSPQSGVGHAVTTRAPMPLEEIEAGRFGLAGTPADCARVSMGKRAAFARERLGGLPQEADLWLISGINHGANLGVDVYISGTAAAAREAAILGYPAIALSQYAGRHREIDWGQTAIRAARVLDELWKTPPQPGCFWNVNFPHPADEGTDQEIVYCPLDPSPHAFEYEARNGALHWISDFHNRPRRPNHDVDVCMGGRISVTELSLHPAPLA